MNKKKIPVVSLIFYILAVITLAYGVWAIVYSAGIVKQAVSLNQLVVAGNEFEVVSFYMSNVAQYVLFALVLFGLGWIVQIITLQQAEDWDDEFEISDLIEDFEEGLEEDLDEDLLDEIDEELSE